MSLKLTTSEFIQRSKEVHGDRYDYSISEYQGNSKPISIICKTHGVFKQQPQKHWNGRGCSVCSGNKPLKNNHIKHGVGYIQLNKEVFAIVDEDMFEYVSKYNWCLDSTGYAKNRTLGHMHRFINKTPVNKLTDHINRNKLDNRKSNLRDCDHSENSMNRIKQKGSYTSIYHRELP